MASRYLPAELLSRMNEQCVELVKQRHAMGKIRHEERSDICMLRIFRYHAMTEQDPFCIGIADKHRLFAGIQKNAVGG